MSCLVGYFFFFFCRKESKDVSTSKTTTIYLACASPVKFSETMKLVDIPLSTADENYNKELYTRTEHYKTLPSDEKEWKNFILDDIREIIKKRIPHAES